MLVTAAPSLPRYSLFFDVVGSDEGRTWYNPMRAANEER